MPLAVSAQKASARFASYDSRLPDIASVLPLLSEGNAPCCSLTLTFDLARAYAYIDLDARGRQGLLKAFDDSIKHLEQAKKATLMRKLLQEDVTSAPTAEELSLLTIMISNIDSKLYDPKFPPLADVCSTLDKHLGTGPLLFRTRSQVMRTYRTKYECCMLGRPAPLRESNSPR